MTAFSDIFTQAYWWLSLLGGLHCLALSIYARFVYQDSHSQRRLLAGIFALMALYFFTGLFNSDNTPAPIHLLFLLLLPLYFLLMPALYQYLKQQLRPTVDAKLPLKHLLPSILAMFLVVLLWLFNPSLVTGVALLGYQPSLSWGSLLLPLLLLLQTTLYMVLVLQLMKRHFHASAQQDNRLQQLRSNWLLVLTLALILNWLVRNIAVLLTLFLGDQFSAVAQAIPRLALLLTLYLLAIYGLNQLTRAAYLRGRESRAQAASVPKQPLDKEELDFLNEILHEKKDK
ncbi:hypothetical protein NDN17_11350 [Shewanella algae]|uniref:hypothetical protein n=1 Tax=Shewanella algae TaxID=38313 RepID=UPI000C3456E2|nr:hypothetical protein [Shewanella algae]MBO2639707.1 hypothetical protein [Shewanella algae]MCM2529110.1 hypothetical protein [Shewanella algae]PSS66403.1 hypothetical protein AYI85_18275 [Shewanella algae]WKC42212.1 hypothetical protein QYM03_01690 [Shewanella algae]